MTCPTADFWYNIGVGGAFMLAFIGYGIMTRMARSCSCEEETDAEEPREKTS